MDSHIALDENIIIYSTQYIAFYSAHTTKTTRKKNTQQFRISFPLYVDTESLDKQK